MTWSEFPTDPSRTMLRQFACGWLVLFVALGLQRWLRFGQLGLGIYLGVMGAVIGVLGLLWPRTLRWLFVGMMALAFPIGWVVTQLALIIIFFGIITPLAWLMRLRGRDVLHLKPDPQRQTWWQPKKPVEDLTRYFRQY